MPTPRQEKLADAIIENLKADIPKTKTEIAVSSGYAPSTAEGGTKDIIEQKGVQEALIARGFTLENAKKVVAEILLNPEEKARDRLTAADMTIKVHGGYAPEKILTQTQNNFFLSSEALQAAKNLEDTLKKQLYAETSQETPQALETGQGTA